ncbi:gliding motility-associated C-terminal domain-containing protein [Tenacibaculum ascidiaceicola]
MKKITSFILLFIVVFLVAGGRLEAQIKKGFQPRFSEAVKGNVTLIANNVLSRNKTTSYTGNDGNHDFSNNVFVDIDNDASTFNSSSANLSNPEPTVSCLSIKKAYLYWAAADKEEDDPSDEPNWDYNKIKLQLPGSLGYTTITADDVIYRGRDEVGHFVNDPYICFKDITNEVKALTTPYGTYQVANVRAKEGSLISHGGGNTGTSGGWQIVFVYESPTLPAKNISLFDGYAHVTSSVNNFEIGFSGFQTVPTGDVDVDVVIGALEGDRDLSGDRLQIKNTSNNWVDLSYSLRSASNFFNSRIAKNGSNFIDRNPASTNTLGFDADVFALSNPGNSIIANNQTSATIRLTSNQETYGLFLIGLSVDVWKPDLAPLILSSSTDTSSVEDSVSFSVNIENNGNDNVKDLKIETTIPQEVDLIEPITGLPFGVTYSYNTTTRLLTFNAIDGITDVGDTPYSLSFQVKVKEQCYFLEEMCSDKFQMQLVATYVGEENNSTQTTLSSKSVDSCGIGDNSPHEISINQPDEANWTTTVGSLDRTVSCDDSVALAAAQLLKPEASCDLTITKVPGSFEASTTNCPVIGTYTNTWTFTDSCGRTSGQFTQTITVTDTTAPVLSSEPADVSVDCEAIPAVPTITATDNCDTVVDVVFTEVSNTVVDGCGEILRQWESTDNCGNTVSHTQTITVTDTTAPVLSEEPADVSVDCEAIPAVPTITATDNCDTVVDVVFTEVSNTVVDGCGEIVRQWESTDNCGNTVSHTQTITVTDTTASVLSEEPADVSVDCEAIPAVPTITATDNCDTVVDVVFTEVSNTVVDGCGEIVRQWESTDNCGNTVSHTQTITVTDTTAPVLSEEPADVSVDCEAIPAVPTITATDNCDTVVDVVFTEVSNTVVDGCGEIVRKWESTDNCGNTVSHTQTITVTDTTAPVLSSEPADVSVDCEAIPAVPTITATDNCDTVVDVVFTEVSNTVVDGCGEIVRQWESTDNCGNTVSHTQTITVTDTTAPVLSEEPADVSVDCEAIPAVPTITATDNCDTVVDVVFTEVSNTVVDGCGEIVRQWESTDNCGNTVSHTQTITVTDTTAPVLSSEPADVSVDCEGIPAVPTITATDNCDTVVDVVFTEVSNTVVDGCGEIVRQWESTDNCGNTVSHTQTITVTDTTAPVLSEEPADVSVDCEAIPAVPTITATDNCDTVVDVVFTEVSNTVVDGCGEIVRQWESTDNCGNTVSHTQTITVTDTTAPVLSEEPADVSVDCEAIPAVPTITATDNCDTVVDVVFTEVSNTVVDGCGEIVRQWESTDNCGNTVSHTQTITVTDTTAPVLSEEPADVSVDCEAIPAVPTITATDNCDTVVDVVFTEVSNTVVDGCGEIVRQWESTDNCGNTVSHTQTITVTDTTAPVLSEEPGDVSVDCEAIPAVPTITATDNCDTVVDVVFTEVSNTVVDGCGEIVRQWESTDNCGNTVSHTQTITVTDITKPEFTVPVDITIYKDDTCVYDANIGITGDVTDESDNCDTSLNASYSDVESAGSCIGEVIVTRTWSLTDNCGNTTEKVQTITVKDNSAPIIDETNKNNIDIECGVGDTETTLQDWLDSNAGATATDNCSSITWTNNYGDDTSVKCDGSYITVTFTATDECGNFSTTTAGYLIKDETSPTITQQPSDKTVECDGAGNTTELNNWLASNGGATATDDCSIVTWSNNYTDLTYTCSFTGEVEVIFTAKDACGNTINTTAAKFTIEDTVAPEFVETLPAAEITVSCDSIPVMETLTATDNCDASITVIPSEVTSGDDDACGSEYLITRKWTVSDCSGNTTTHIQVITVEDTTAPEFVETLPAAEITVSCDNIPVMETLTATDNCDASVTVIPSEVTSGDDDACGSEYLITRKWTVSDCSGNTTTHIQVITVEDTTAPEFVETLPAAEITVSCDNIPVMETLTATDNCDASVTVIPSEVTSGDDDACGSEYLITRKWTVSDCSGNTTTHIQVITVEDTTAPEFVETLPAAEITVSCDNIPVMETLTATDNCDASVTVIPSEVTSGDDDACGSEYLITRKWTVSDCSGNTTTHIQVITVEDTTAPEFVETLPAAEITVSCDNIPVMETLTATDNCDASVTVIPSEVTSGDDDACGSEYLITRKWTVQDCAGNTTSHTQVVTVEDTTAPEFVEELPADVTVSCDAVPAAVVLTATDNCDTSVTVNYSKEFTGQDDECASVYAITRTWEVQDCAGNTTSHTQVVTIEDTTAPEFVGELPTDVTVSCDAVPAAVVLTATDNCDTSVTVNYSEEFTGQDDECASVYAITRTWEVQDCAGNTTSHTQVVTIEDTTAPEFVEELPTDVTVSCDAVPAAVVLTATDNCDTSVTVNYSEEFTGQDDECASVYAITRTWEVQDCAGNTTSHTQVVTIEDTTAPEFVEELPTDVTVSCDAVPAAVVLTATDNCDTSVTVNYSEEFTGQDDECASVYTITRTWEVQDCAGNTTSHTQVVIVEDTTAPEFVGELPTDVTVSCDAIPEAVTLTGTDNCDSEVIVVYSEELSGQEEGCASEYTITRTWEVQDCAGNSTSHTQVITIEDNEAPTLVSTLEDITVECDNVPEVPTLEFTDNCSSNVTQTNFEETSTFDGSDSDYTITRTWTVTDDCGNVADFTQYITVTVKTSVTEIADSRCIDDGTIDLNDYLANQSEDGTWEVTQGSVTLSDDGSFDPSGLNLGDYIFTYTSPNNGCLTSTKVTININDDCIVLPCGQEDVVISKAVTPNGDSWNEFFEVTGVESCGFIVNVKIFNRWGAKVFESNNYANNWNGVSDGATFGGAERLPAGTYYYIVILENSGLKPFTGAIYLGTK